MVFNEVKARQVGVDVQVFIIKLYTIVDGRDKVSQ